MSIYDITFDEGALDTGLDPFTEESLNYVAGSKFNSANAKGLLGESMRGVSPREAMLKIKQQREQVQALINARKVPEMNMGGYNQSATDFQALLENAPQAPQFENPAMSQDDALIAGVAAMLGVDPSQAFGAAMQGAQNRAALANEFRARGFDQQLDQYNAQLRAGGQRMMHERSLAETQYRQDVNMYNRGMTDLTRRDADLAREEDRLIDNQRLAQAQDELKYNRAQSVIDNNFKLIGDMTPDVRKRLEDKLVSQGLDLNKLFLPPVGTQTQQTQAQAQNVQEKQADRVQRGKIESERIKQREAERKQRSEAEAKRAKQADERIKLQKERAQSSGRGSGRGGSVRRSPKAMAGEIGTDEFTPIEPGSPSITIDPTLTPKVVNQLVRELEKFENDIQTLRAEQRQATDKAARQKIEAKIQGLIIKRDARKERLGIDRKTPMDTFRQALNAITFQPGAAKSNELKPDIWQSKEKQGPPAPKNTTVKTEFGKGKFID